MMDTLTQEFADGVDAYWSGECPEGWDNYEARCKSPYLTGWYMAGMWETQPGYLRDHDGEPFQYED